MQQHVSAQQQHHGMSASATQQQHHMRGAGATQQQHHGVGGPATQQWRQQPPVPERTTISSHSQTEVKQQETSTSWLKNIFQSVLLYIICVHIILIITGVHQIQKKKR